MRWIKVIGKVRDEGKVYVVGSISKKLKVRGMYSDGNVVMVKNISMKFNDGVMKLDDIVNSDDEVKGLIIRKGSVVIIKIEKGLYEVKVLEEDWRMEKEVIEKGELGLVVGSVVKVKE